MTLKLIHQYSLPNGLRVVLAPDPRTPRVGVAVHYGVGFRSEEPGHAGFAHLIEHLMFRGSQNLPDGRFHDHIVQSFGESGGTTRQDYTEYFQKVPVGALEAALFAEADRMRAPLFTEESVREQLRGVLEEIADKNHDGPLGGFPWPRLPAAVYRTWSNAHDGFGSPEELVKATPDQCAAFFHRHYVPSNAVLTLTGDFPWRRAIDLVERHFGDIERDAPSLEAPADEPDWIADQWHSGTQPGLSGAAVAFAHRLPSPQEDLDRYLSYMLAAELLADAPVDLPGGTPARVDSSCGFFEPLDTRGADTLVTTALIPAAEHAAPLLAGLRDRVTGLAHPSGAGREAAARLTERHHREHADPMRLARSLGRTELLLGDAGLLHRIPGRLHAAADLLPETARRLGIAHAAVLVLEPGATRRSPTHLPSEPETPRPRRSAARLGSASGRSRTPADLVPQTADVVADVFDTTVDGRIRLVGARDSRAPFVELRLRVPLGTRVWARPGREARLLHALQIRLCELGGPAPGTSLDIDTDGEWLTAAGTAPWERVRDWLTRLAAVITGAAGTWAQLPPPRLPQSPHVLADVAIRALRLTGVETADEDPVVPPAPDGALLVAVGPVDPERLRVMASESLSDWWTRAPDGPVKYEQWEPNGEPLLLPGRSDSAHVTLCTPEPVGIPSRSSLYLALAALGSHPTSRLASAALRLDSKGAIVFAGRGWYADQACVFVRSSQPRERLEAILSMIRRELRRLADDPPRGDELAGVVDYCTAQIPYFLDSPRTFADMLATGVGDPFGARWATEAVTELRGTGAEEVREAAELLGRADFQAVAVVPRTSA